MAQDYYISSCPELEHALEGKFATSKKTSHFRYLVSNSEGVDAEIYAPEINFYIRNSGDTLDEKIESIKTLYEIRAAEFNLAKDVELQIPIGTNVLLAADEVPAAIQEDLEQHGYCLTVIHPADITSITGYIGNFSVRVRQENQTAGIETDRIIWFDMPVRFSGAAGTYDPHLLGWQETVEQIFLDPGVITSSKSIIYDKSLCNYHGKRVDVCGKCTEVCAVQAIEKLPESRKLNISPLLCTGCGACVPACPAGALDYAKVPRYSFEKICSFYRDKIALIIPRRIRLEKLRVALPEHVLPLTVENENFLDECHLLTLLQESGRPVVIYSDRPSAVLMDIIQFLNQILQRRFNSDAIFCCDGDRDLQTILSDLPTLQNCSYTVDSGGLHKREMFSKRLAHMVGADDLGEIVPGEALAYGNLTIAQDTCTLCLSCAQACCLDALEVHPEDNTLRYTPSLCTSCGYCEVTCPETDCLHIIHNTLLLHPDYFRPNIVARDELQHCSECNRKFAPKKSIDKIAGIMKPFFAKDPVKLKTLYCCPDCKARIMIENRIADEFNSRGGA